MIYIHESNLISLTMSHPLALSALAISIFVSGCGGSSGCSDKKLGFGYLPFSNCEEESQLTNSDDSIIALKLRNAIATTTAVFIITPP